jgi:hypothetical protein
MIRDEEWMYLDASHYFFNQKGKHGELQGKEIEIR